MNNKQLAEMIKRLRKEKQDELAMTDMNTTSNMKGAGHDVAENVIKEYSVRAMVKPSTRKGRLTPAGHMSHTKQTDITKAGPGLKNKYTLSKPVSEDKEEVTKTKTGSKKNKDVINTSPEQDSAMIGTQ